MKRTYFLCILKRVNFSNNNKSIRNYWLKNKGGGLISFRRKGVLPKIYLTSGFLGDFATWFLSMYVLLLRLHLNLWPVMAKQTMIIYTTYLSERHLSVEPDIIVYLVSTKKKCLPYHGTIDYRTVQWNERPTHKSALACEKNRK